MTPRSAAVLQGGAPRLDGIVQKACTGLAARQPGMRPPSNRGGDAPFHAPTHARPTYRGKISAIKEKTSALRDRPQGAIHNLAGNTRASHGRWKVRQALPRGLHSEGKKVQQVQGGGCGYCLQHSYNSGSSKEGTSLRAANQLR